MTPPRAEELLSYFTGLAPIGEPVTVTREIAMADLIIKNNATYYDCLNYLIGGRFIRRVGTGIIIVLRRPEEMRKSRIEALPEKKLRDELEILAEENHQLKATIARLTGSDSSGAARKVFGLTEAEANIVMILVERGVATYDHIQSAIYSFDTLERINDVGEAIRSHIKRIRQKLRPRGLDFSTTYGLGFEMDDAGRAKARALLNTRAG